MDCSPQVSLSMGLSRQEHWSGFQCPPLGDLPDSGIKPTSLMSPALIVRFFTRSATWEAPSDWQRGGAGSDLSGQLVVICDGSPRKLTYKGLERAVRVRGEPRGSPWEDPLPQRRGSPVRGPRPPPLRKETLKLAHCEQPRWAGPQPTHVSFPAPRAAPWSSRSQRHSRGKLRMKHSPFPRSAPTYPAHRHKRATKDTA